MKVFFTFVMLFSIVHVNLGQEQFGGATLYTVRNEMEKSPKETLKAIADMGYVNIEVTGYKEGMFYGMTPSEFKDYVSGLGLNAVSGHFASTTYDNADTLIADAKAAGLQYFVIPIPPMGHFTYDPATQSMGMKDDVAFVNTFLNEIGKKCKESGLQLLYHNHDFEFKEINGVRPLDYFLENTDPEYVNFQLDLYWITKAGEDPLSYFEAYPGRFKMWHVKDMDSEGKFAPVGKGTIDFARILEKHEQSGLEYYIVEQDMTWELAPLEAIKISRQGLKKFGFDGFQ